MNTDPILRVRRSATPGKRPTLDQIQLGEIALNTFDAELYTKRERVGIGTDIVRIGSGTTVTNVLYVTKDGKDTNTGRKLGDAKATIKAAAAVAAEGAVIKVSAGSYVEDNPIELKPQISVVGDSLREVSVTPLNADQDLFHFSPGNYVTEMSFTGTLNPGSAIAAFNPNQIYYFTQSPYIRNCTNFIHNSIGLKINGNHSIGPTKSMVTDSFTQYNQGGIGVSITNEGYAQLVSLFTICNDIAVFCGSGGACDLTNSNSSFGNYALVADGIGPLKCKGVITESYDRNQDTFTIDLTTPSRSIVSAAYSKETGITTIITSNAHEFTVGMGVTLKNLAFSCPPTELPVISTRTISNAVYDNVTGIATITTSASNHRFSVGMGISLAGLQFSCPSGPAILTYPSGNEGYVFRVDNIPASNKFEVNVGVSTLPHTYVSGGTADFVGYVFPSGNYGHVFTVQDVIDPYTFVVNTGISTFNHSYISGGSVKINVVRPYDGQVIYFEDLYYSISDIIIDNPGDGYVGNALITIDDPTTPWGVPATAVAVVKNGQVVSTEIISNGRGYTTTPSVTISPPSIGINTATATIKLLPTYYSITKCTPLSSGICTVTVSDNVPYSVGLGTNVYFFKQSRVLASGHSLEYIGTGVDIDQALPSVGGVPIQENETDSRNGGLVVYTSTDQSGNFRIGDGVVVNQQTGTISGKFYSKSLFSAMTPFILALGGD